MNQPFTSDFRLFLFLFSLTVFLYACGEAGQSAVIDGNRPADDDFTTDSSALAHSDSLPLEARDARELADFFKTGSDKDSLIAKKVDLPDPMPRVSMPQRTYEFGFIDEGTLIKHSFSITNKGDANLFIKDITADCGCTVPTYSSKAVAPGESTEIQVVFDSENKFGKQAKSISIYTNARKRPYTFTFKGIVRPKDPETAD